MRTILLLSLALHSGAAALVAAASLGAEGHTSPPPRPAIDGEWWTIAGNPDLGALTNPRQQPVDFAVWQAADGKWQLWSCIRHTNCGGKTRLFHGWESERLTTPNWESRGIAMQAEPSLGETAGGLQAPHVIRDGGVYYLFYGDWERICLATSRDGKKFERFRNKRGQPALFSGPYPQSRDPMVVKIGSLFYCYYTGHREKTAPPPLAAVFCRTSHDLLEWSEPIVVSAGGAARTRSDWHGGDAECPFVVDHGGWFYLFRNQVYLHRPLNTQYASPNPISFGVDNDRHEIGTLPVAAPEIIRHEGQDYVAALLPDLKGIRIARLKWVARP